MRSAAIVALIVAGIAFPACAQHGGARGGSSGHAGGSGVSGHSGSAGHSAPAFHGRAPARPAPIRSAAPRTFAVNRPLASVSNLRPRTPGTSVGRQPYRGQGGDRNRDRHRAPYISPYLNGYSYYGYSPWLGGYDPDLWGSSDDGDSDNSQTASGDSGAQYQSGQDQGVDNGQYPGGYGPPPGQYPTAYRPPVSEPRPSQAAAAEEAVTLVFKDGRPPEQVHNYVLTRTTLFVQDQNRRSIPVDQIDIAATEKTNRDAGVEFQVPKLPN